MKRIKDKTIYEPEISREQILAFDPERPDTYTGIKLVDTVLSLFSKKEVLIGGMLAERMGLDSKHLAHALEILTGMNTSALRAELVANRWRKVINDYKDCTELELAQAIGFADESSLIRFIERNKKRFPELYIKEQEAQHRLAPIVEEIMGNESASVRRLYTILPFRGDFEEQVACLRLLYTHARAVADHALAIAKKQTWEVPSYIDLVEEAALLHNIGIVFTNRPDLHCHGPHDYSLHAQLGSDFLSRHTRSRSTVIAANYHCFYYDPASNHTTSHLLHHRLTLDTHSSLHLITNIIAYSALFHPITSPTHTRTLPELRHHLTTTSSPQSLQTFNRLEEMFG